MTSAPTLRSFSVFLLIGSPLMTKTQHQKGELCKLQSSCLAAGSEDAYSTVKFPKIIKNLLLNSFSFRECFCFFFFNFLPLLFQQLYVNCSQRCIKTLQYKTNYNSSQYLLHTSKIFVQLNFSLLNKEHIFSFVRHRTVHMVQQGYLFSFVEW